MDTEKKEGTNYRSVQDKALFFAFRCGEKVKITYFAMGFLRETSQRIWKLHESVGKNSAGFHRDTLRDFVEKLRDISR